MISPDELKQEILKDPLALGYKAVLDKGSDAAIADILNLPREGNEFKAERQEVTITEFVAALDPGEFLSLPTENVQKLQIVLTAQTLAVNNENTKVILEKLFQGASSTLANLAVLQVRQGSRAESLFGAGTVVSQADISFALRGGK